MGTTRGPIMKLQTGIFHRTEGLILLTEIVQNCFYQWMMDRHIVLLVYL